MDFSLDQFYRLNRRALIWIILFVLLWLMRDFFALIFLTFVLAFISAPLIRLCQRWLRLPRRVSIIFVYTLFLAGLVSLVTSITPRVVREATTLLGNLSSIETKLIDLKSRLVLKYPALKEAVPGYLESALNDQAADDLRRELDGIRQQLNLSEQELLLRGVTPSTDTLTLGRLAQFDKQRDELLIRKFMAQQVTLLQKGIPKALNFLYLLSVTTLLALLFSFLTAMDLSRLSRELASLRESRLHDFYEQTAQPVVRFGYVVGRALQAQAVIACANTVLTLLGMLVLGIPSLAMLSVVVFLCSFIPVLGVFISTMPILLVALNSGGIPVAGAVVAMVCIVHLVEAYVLNPLIYGRHLKLNPLVVLIILFVGHHLFGIWGMILGVPVTHYVLHDVFGVPVWGQRRLAPAAHPRDEQ